MLFSRRFSRTCLEGISFKFFVCFIFNVSLGSAPKRKNFDIQRNTRVGSGGQFTSNRLPNDHIKTKTLKQKAVYIRNSTRTQKRRTETDKQKPANKTKQTQLLGPKISSISCGSINIKYLANSLILILDGMKT